MRHHQTPCACSLQRLCPPPRYKLQDYWEMPYWPVSMLVNTTTPPQVHKRNMSLWQMGNMAIACE